MEMKVELGKDDQLAEKTLELVKEKPVLICELQEKLGLAREEVFGAVAFLQKYKLVEITPIDTPGGDEMVWIMPKGLQLLNLPEDELPSNQLEVLEKHWGDDVDDIGRKWLFLMQLKNKISCELGRSQGAITIKQEGGNYTLTAIIPKEEGGLHLQKGDIPKCHHTSEEVKMEIDALFKRRRGTSNE